jgi:hypothetical protein
MSCYCIDDGHCSEKMAESEPDKVQGSAALLVVSVLFKSWFEMGKAFVG